ncbi:MAG: class I SAM-dependent methyltransferase [Clostridiales bacterium]|jgi:16S rRNA (guanine1207-N2)-methyltransferase|nr:class I SAM-dependent methyltransferase [Clostridiales bacterium]
MEHYYTNNPQTPHDIRSIDFVVNQLRLELYTDAGVFSKNKVDYGSEILIKSLPELNGNILDLGCGYGVIGLSIAGLYPKSQVTMVDINQRAVETTQQNIERNQIKNAATYVSDGFDQVNGLFNAIVSNPPIRAGKNVIYPLFEQSLEFLLPGGSLYLVIQKKQGAKSAMEKLQSVFGNCEVINKQGGYWILKSTKESS